jgi:hypothetical protein
MEGSSMTRFFGLLAFGTVLLCGCANSTQMVATWRDPSAPMQHYHRTLAVFMSKDPGMRRMVEDKLASRLPGGVPSYTVIPDAQLGSMDSVHSRVKTGGFDGAVVMRLVNVETQVTETAAPHDFYGYWNYWSYAYDPVYYTTEKLYSVESSLYSFQDGKMIWMGRSQTVDPKNANKLADYSVNFAVKNMKKQGVLP